MKETYIKKLINANLRADGRQFDQFREVKIETDVIGSAEGSARVTIGETMVIAGIKLAVKEPYPDSPNEGSMMVDVEFVPFASPDFEPGPPNENAIEVARVVDRGIRESKTIDTEKLAIVPGEVVWNVHIDVHIINHDGNLMDAVSLAAIAALRDAKMPKYDEGKKKIVKDGTKVAMTEEPLPLKDVPIEVTTAKIGNRLLVDPSAEEEVAVDARVTIATTEKGDLCAIQKAGNGYFTTEELLTAAQLSLEKGKELRALLM